MGKSLRDVGHDSMSKVNTGKRARREQAGESAAQQIMRQELLRGPKDGPTKLDQALDTVMGKPSDAAVAAQALSIIHEKLDDVPLSLSQWQRVQLAIEAGIKQGEADGYERGWQAGAAGR